jgi:G3E family GTPase
VNAIESLMEKKGAFDYILLETTGLADPGNLAPLFWVDEGLGSTIYLDGIVTLIDAKNILKSLDEPAPEHMEHEAHEGPSLTTAHLQISHADVIVLNKSDLVSEEELQAVRERIQAINGLAKIHVTQQGQVPQLEGFLLDLHAYDNVGALQVAEKGHSHLDPVRLHDITAKMLTDNVFKVHVYHYNLRAASETKSDITARQVAPICSLGVRASYDR